MYWYSVWTLSTILRIYFIHESWFPLLLMKSQSILYFLYNNEFMNALKIYISVNLTKVTPMIDTPRQRVYRLNDYHRLFPIFPFLPILSVLIFPVDLHICWIPLQAEEFLKKKLQIARLDQFIDSCQFHASHVCFLYKRCLTLEYVLLGDQYSINFDQIVSQI